MKPKLRGRPRTKYIPLHEAAADIGVAATTLLGWERDQRIPRLKRHPNWGGGRPSTGLSREQIEHIKALRAAHGPRLQNYRIGYGQAPIGK